MKRFVSLKLCGILLLVSMLFGMFPQIAYAQTTYTVETGNRTVSVYPTPYSEGGEIMVPLKGITEGLGGIWLDVPTGQAHKAAVLNDIAFLIISGWNVQVTLPLSEDVTYDAFIGAETVEDYIPIIMSMLYDGTIPIKYIDYPIIERDGDTYLPLREFASGLNLDYSVNGNTIIFDSAYTGYQPTDSNVTFRLDIQDNEKTYDGKPITWSQDELKVFYNGTQVTDYLPLTLDYSYMNMNNEMQSISSQPKDAGGYALSVYTNPNDPKYSGTGYFSFMIYPAELTLTAKDAEISAGEPLPPFSYDIYGIVPGESRTDAIVKDPVLTAKNAVKAGTYPIEIVGGTAGKNYTIKNRHPGTLTIFSQASSGTYLVRCVDQATNRILRTDTQQATIGASITVTAPDVTDYQVQGSKTQEIIVSDNSIATFYYTQIPKQADTPAPVVYGPYITGYSNGTFHPQDPIKRSACAAMLHRMIQQMGSNGTSGNQGMEFTDVPANAWYHDAVCALAAKGITSGYSDGTFRPENAVTRAEFVVFALRFAGTPTETGSRQFSDVPTSYWAANHIQTAVKNGFISGYSDGSFRPDQQITRAAAVTILNRISGRDQCVVADNASSFSDVPSDFWAYQAIMLAANQSVSR